MFNNIKYIRIVTEIAVDLVIVNECKSIGFWTTTHHAYDQRAAGHQQWQQCSILIKVQAHGKRANKIHTCQPQSTIYLHVCMELRFWEQPHHSNQRHRPPPANTGESADQQGIIVAKLFLQVRVIFASFSASH